MPDDSLSPETEMLAKAQANGKASTLKAYLKLSGPGWLQSAITLGGGSLSGALFLGVVGGYQFLWVQLFAMVMGVIMLCAISYVTLSTGESPFQSLRLKVNPVLAWGWLAASLAANLVWILPQYSLAYAALSQNLLPAAFANESDSSKYLVSILLFAIVASITLAYGRGGLGIKIYETALKLVVAGIVLSFIGVVIKLATSASDFQIEKVVAGFVPDPRLWFTPAEVYSSYLEKLNTAASDYWAAVIVDAQRTRLIGAASAAVGINMTFLLPYSMLNKRWGKQHRGLAIFDLSTGMVLPFVFAVSCVVIASAYMFHGKPYEGLLAEQSGELVADVSNSGYGGYVSLITAREAFSEEMGPLPKPVADDEKRVAALLINRDTRDFSQALTTLFGNATVANLLFGLGVLAMALSTMSMLMLISGFVFSEMFNKPHGGLVHKLGVLCGALGIFWPEIWSGGSKAFLAVVTSTIGYILLPIAFLAFFAMMNSRSILKENLPKGRARLVWNTLMGISLAVTGSAAAYTATTKSLGGFPIGTIGGIAFLVALVIGQFYISKKSNP